jgi:hypothetical protein
MGDADGAGRRIARQLAHQVDQLALRAAADELPAVQGADPGAVIAAILHAAQTIDEPVRDFFLADDADDSTHLGCAFTRERRGR